MPGNKNKQRAKVSGSAVWQACERFLDTAAPYLIFN
jgi:hypothetical protein